MLVILFENGKGKLAPGVTGFPEIPRAKELARFEKQEEIPAEIVTWNQKAFRFWGWFGGNACYYQVNFWTL